MSWNKKSCVVDNRFYKSMFSAAIDFELNYSWLVLKLKKSGGAPVVISGHTIALSDQKSKEKNK